MSGFLQDLRYAVRGLRKSPGFTVVAVLTLALGIGANTAMFSVLNAVLLRPLPYPSPEQLAMLWTEMPDQAVREGRSAYRDVEQWKALSKSFVDIAVFDGISTRLTAPGEVERISVVRASPSFFTLLGVQPVRGRIFSNDEADRRQRVVVISHDFWQTRLGGAEDVIGADIAIDGVPSEVVGILPPIFQFPGANADVWEPHTMFPDWEVRRGERGASSWLVLGRVRPGVTIQQAQMELSGIARALDRQRSASERDRGVSVVPLSAQVIDAKSRLALWILMGAVFCVFLVAVTNITSVSLARAASRERELAIRSALGATRARLFRHVLAESLTLAVPAGSIGLAIAVMGIPLIETMKPADLAVLERVRVDTRVLCWTLGLSLLTGILVGLAPAIAAARRNLRSALSDGSRGTSAGTSTRVTRRALVMAELALAIVLLVGAGLLTRSLLNVLSVDPGFAPERVLSIQLSLPAFEAIEQRTAYYDQVIEHVGAVGGVENAAVIGDLFVGGSPEQVITVEGRGVSDRLRLRRDEVSSGFFATLQIPVLRGRSFSSADGPSSPRAAIINTAMGRRLWPAQEPIGKRFKFGGLDSASPWFTVVGVVGDMRRQGLEDAPVAQMFEPLAQNPSRLATLLVRTSNDPLSMVGAIQAAIRRADKYALMYGVTTLVGRIRTFQAQRRFQTGLLIAFSIVALLLAAIGIYGVIQYSVVTRTREIGIRMAVGAERGDVVKMIVGEGLKLSLTGLAVGLVGALWLAHAVSSLLFGVTARDPLTYVVVSLLLTAVATWGSYIPARRAARVDPLVALRCE